MFGCSPDFSYLCTIQNKVQPKLKRNIMLQSDKDALHYEVVAQTAHKIEKVATELARLHKDSILNNERIELRKKHLLKYLDELSNLL